MIFQWWNQSSGSHSVYKIPEKKLVHIKLLLETHTVSNQTAASEKIQERNLDDHGYFSLKPFKKDSLIKALLSG